MAGQPDDYQRRVRKARKNSACPRCRSWITTGNRIVRLADNEPVMPGNWVCIACALSLPIGTRRTPRTQLLATTVNQPGGR